MTWPTATQGVATLLELDSDGGDAPTRLLLAAADAFADRGFHATSTRDIAARAKMSPAGVYVHYATKEALLFDLSRRGHAAARDHLVEAAGSQTSPEGRLRAVIGGFARWHAENHLMGRIVQYEFRNLSPEHQGEVIALRKQIDDIVRGILDAGVDAGVFRVDDTRVTALALMSLVVDVARWYVPGVRLTPEEIEATYADLAVRLVGI